MARHLAFLGLFIAVVTSQNCTFCPEDGPRGEPFPEIETALISEFGFNSNCSDLEYEVTLDARYCNFIQGTALPALCGCNVPGYVPCRFSCGEGEVLVDAIGGNIFPDYPNVGIFRGCEILVVNALIEGGSSDSTECAARLQDVNENCECVPIVPCAGVCPDGSAPPGIDLVVPETLSRGTKWSNKTCGELDIIAKTDNQASFKKSCTDIQDTALFCGCAGATPCLGMCPNAEDPLAPETGILTFSSSYSYLASNCGEFNDRAKLIPDSSPRCGLSELQTLCQCPGVETCSLCPDGQAALNTESEFEYILGDIFSCQDLESLAGRLIPNGRTCDDVQYYRLLCQCPGVQPLCSLCEDGSMLPDPSFQLEETDSWSFTCLELQGVFGLNTESCTQIQATFGTYCGCTNPIGNADNELCRLCGEDLLPDPSVIVNGPFFLASCAQFELEANEALEFCSEYQADFSEECCNVDVATTTPGSVAASSISVVSCLLAMVAFVFL